jgi:hypothetical protein
MIRRTQCRRARPAARKLMPRTTRMAVLALAAMTSICAWIGAASAEEADYLRLRPLKEPNNCIQTTSGNVSCPGVSAPRINRRHSTIPGIQHPDRGRPPVPILGPPSPRATTGGFRSIGGNPGIVGQ